MADRIEVNPERLRQAVKLVDDLLDMFCRRTGLDSWQILGEEKLPDDAELSLSAHDIYNVVDMLHDAQTALAFAPGIPPFTILGSMIAGDPDSYMPTPEGLVWEAEDITRQATDDEAGDGDD